VGSEVSRQSGQVNRCGWRAAKINSNYPPHNAELTAAGDDGATILEQDRATKGIDGRGQRMLSNQ
jgi:hypothetical protein